MTELETRLPCPVCLGTRMEKVHIPGRRLTVDCCRRCGGIWFEQGEVQQVHLLEREPAMRQLGATVDVARAPCHACRAPVARDQHACHACGHEIRLACPACQKTMLPARAGELRLDVCTACRGVWFDRHELAGIWSGSIHSLLAHRTVSDPHDLDGLLLLDALVWSPDLLFFGVHAAGELASAGGSAVADAAGSLGAVELSGSIGGAAEAAGEAASSVFETIAEIIGGLFG